MKCEVAVVGGGIGGLTVAALLARRGVDVCLFERNSYLGGCAANFQSGEHEFESTAGIFAGWNPGEIHDRVFSELETGPPEVTRLDVPYVVRLADSTSVAVAAGSAAFEDAIRAAFPECAETAMRFYREIELVSSALHAALSRVPAIRSASRLVILREILRSGRAALAILSTLNDTAAHHMQGASARFRSFIDAQLQMFALSDSVECSFLHAAAVLMLPLRGMHTIAGGCDALINRLASAAGRFGGRIRLNSPVLRLVFDSGGHAAGIDLLSGERVQATRAVVSNLTVWDTYGKLAGPGRAPDSIRQRLKAATGRSVFLAFVAIDDAAAKHLPCDRTLVVAGDACDPGSNPELAQFMIAVSPQGSTRFPSGKRAATIVAKTEPTRWFAFHTDDAEHEGMNHQMLGSLWQRFCRAFPFAEDSAEVIETVTPLTIYENTRRRFGMVCGTGQSGEYFGANSFSHKTPIRNLFITGDTVFPGSGVAAVSYSALAVANEIAPPKTGRAIPKPL